MAEQPRYDPLEPSRFFADGKSARHPVPGTVARGQLRDDLPFFTGKKARAPTAGAGREAEATERPGPSLDRAGEYVEAFPVPVTPEVMRRGRERFNIYCAPCHGRTGTGTGPVVEAGYPRAQSFHTDRLRRAPVGYFFDVITQGHGKMPPYARQVPPQDRWAIIAYVRALQLSRHARLKELPARLRRHFNEQGREQR